MSFMDQLRQADLVLQGVFVAITGLVVVFLVLSLFYATIKAMQRIGRNKKH